MSNNPTIDKSGVHVVVSGEKWYKFSARFEYSEKPFTFDFFARSHEEAIEMLRSIRRTAVECDQIIEEIGAGVPCAGIWIRLSCWWRNLFASIA